METILEQQRRYHEEGERLMDAKTKEMLHKKTTVRSAEQLKLTLLTLLTRTGSALFVWTANC